MAQLFVLASLLQEANSLDNYESRRQAQIIRRQQLLLRNQDYVATYRLSLDLIECLERDLEPLMRRAQCLQRGITIRTKILCTLSFLANGSYQKNIGKNVFSFLSQSSTSRCIREVVEALNHPSMVRKFIRFPQNAAERQILKERFYDKYKFPGAVACIDGFFVAMVRPQEHEERYYCRKGNHARNILLVSDADLNILHVDPTYGGATHDSFIFNHSDLKYHLESLVNNGETVFLLGRFRSLLVHRVLHYHRDMVAKIVVACSILHNICNRAGLPAPSIGDTDAQHETNFGRRTERDTQDIDDLAIGRIHQQEVVRSMWRARHIN